MKNTLKLKNTIEGIKSKVIEAEEWIRDLKEKNARNHTKNRIKKKRM